MNARRRDRRSDLPGTACPPAGARPRPACASVSSTRSRPPSRSGRSPRSSVRSATRTRSPAAGACSSRRRFWSRWQSRAPRSRGVAPPPAGSRRRPEPRAAGRRPGVRPLELRAAAAAAAPRPDLARRATRPRAASTSIGRGRSDSIGSRQPMRPSPPATGSSAAAASAGWRPSGPTRSGSNQGHEAIGDDPRVWIRTVLSAEEGPGCEMERDPSEVGNGTAATGWRYVGVEYVAGRPTHHCRVRRRHLARHRDPADPAHPGPAVDDAGQPIPGQFAPRSPRSRSASSRQRCSKPPEGVARMSARRTARTSARGDLPNERLGSASGLSADRKRRLRRRPTRPLRCPPRVPDRAVRRPSEPTGPLAWTQASLNEDWPAPVRPEPAGGASVEPMPLTYIDPSGDTGSDAYPCVDIREVKVRPSAVHHRHSGPEPTAGVDPTEQWIAYGVVIDDDRDGVPDWRYRDGQHAQAARGI